MEAASLDIYNIHPSSDNWRCLLIRVAGVAAVEAGVPGGETRSESPHGAGPATTEPGKVFLFCFVFYQSCTI